MKGAVLLGLYIVAMLGSIVLQTGGVAAQGQNVCFNQNGQGCSTANQQSITPGTSFITYAPNNGAGCKSQGGGGASFGPVQGVTWTVTTIYSCQASSLAGYPNGFVVWFPISPSGSNVCFGCNSLSFPSSVDCGRDCAATPLYTNCAIGNNPQIPGTFLTCTLLQGYNPPPASTCNPISGLGGNCGSTGISFGFLSNPITDVIIVIGIATIAGLTVLGSGFSPETIRIIFLGGFFLGVYSILGLTEGSLANAPGSILFDFNQWANGAGTILFFLLSLGYAIGIITLPAPGA